MAVVVAGLATRSSAKTPKKKPNVKRIGVQMKQLLCSSKKVVSGVNISGMEGCPSAVVVACLMSVKIGAKCGDCLAEYFPRKKKHVKAVHSHVERNFTAFIACTPKLYDCFSEFSGFAALNKRHDQYLSCTDG